MQTQFGELKLLWKDPVAIWCALTLLIFVALSVSFVTDALSMRAEVKRFQEAGKQSPAHEFASSKYIACRDELPEPSQDECVSRLLVIAGAKGQEFQSQVGAAVIELGLVK